MWGRLAACIDVVVTSGAAASHNSSVGKTGGFPGSSRMACIAGLGRRNMRDILGLGVDGNIGSVMAARTVAGGYRARCAAVAHRCRCKSRVILVASITLRRSGNMEGRLTEGAGAVMTGRAPAGGRRVCGSVIEGGRCPANGRVVAGITLRRGQNMSRGLGLRVLSDVGAAVAGRAPAGQPGVVHHGGRPGGIAAGVAGITLGSRRDMRCRLGKRIDRNVTAVVASRAVGNRNRPRCPGVAHRGRAEGIVVVMAGGALSGSRNMCGWLAQGGCSIVTGRTHADRAGIMGIGSGGPGHCRFMAGVALRRGADVSARFDLSIDRQVSPCMASRTITSCNRAA